MFLRVLLKANLRCGLRLAQAEAPMAPMVENEAHEAQHHDMLAKLQTPLM